MHFFICYLKVSKAWGAIADDNLLWERLYCRIKSTFTGLSVVDQSDNWKETVKDCYVWTKTLLLNWKVLV